MKILWSGLLHRATITSNNSKWDGHNCKIPLHSMRWFSHRHGPSPPGGHAIVSSVATCYALPMGMSQQFFIFRPWWPWPLTLAFELGRDFCSLTNSQFDHPTFSRSEVIVRIDTLTNKHTLLKHPPRFTTLHWSVTIYFTMWHSVQS